MDEDDDTQTYKDDGNALLIAYQSGYYDGKKAQLAQRKPLTDDELADFWYKESIDWMEFARAIEAAHGVKEKNT